MSAGRRSFGVGFFAAAFTVSSILGILFWASSLSLCVTRPDLFAEATQHLAKNALPENLLHWYENTLLFLYLFIGIGLWRLRPWAYRLLILVLAVELLRNFGLGLKTGIGGDPVAAGELAGQSLGKIFLLIFFLRKKVRDQFAEEAGPSMTVPAIAPEVALAMPPVLDFAASEVIRQKRHEEGEATGELERLAGAEKVLCWAVMLAGIFLSLKQKMTVVTGGLFGGLWGIESYIICFYIFRAKKLPALAGGALSVGLALGFSAFGVPGLEGQWTGYATHLIPGFCGGLAAGFMVRHNRWFHGSSAGFVWAVFYFLRDFYQRHGWTPALEKLDFMQVLYSSLIILVIGLLGGAFGGLLSFFKPQGSAQTGRT